MTDQTALIPSGDLQLEGALHLPAGSGPFAGVVVCHPHPQYGGDMHNNVVVALCDALLGRGIAALRFNFRGVGKSGGAFDGGRGEALDAAAALAWLGGREEIAADRVGLAGYSFGAIAALTAAEDGFRALALVSPPLQWLERGRLECIAAPLLVVAGDQDPIAPAGAFRELAATLPATAEARLVSGADHSWWGYDHELGEIAGAFFARHLAEEGGEAWLSR